MSKARSRPRTPVDSSIGSSLESLDSGAYSGSLESYAARSAPPESLQEYLWCAEVSLYLDRRDEARVWLAQVGELADSSADEGSIGDLSRRAALVAAELDYFDGDLSSALAQFASILTRAETARDPAATMRARYDIGRTLRRQARYADSLEVLAAARRLAVGAGNRFYEGLIAYNVAFCLYEISDTGASAAFERALDLLRESEDLRYRAVCESYFGVLLVDRGEVERALGMLDHAHATLVEIGVVSEALGAANNAARAYLSVGRPSEAIARLEPLVGFERSTRHSHGEFNALGLLTLARCASGAYEQAEASADEALRLAEIVGTPSDVLDARILRGRVDALRGKSDAVDDQRRLVAEADANGSGFQRAHARVYLAETLRASAPFEAFRLLDEVSGMPAEWAGGVVAMVRDRVQRDLDLGPIRRGPRGEIVIDPEAAVYPNLQTAIDLVERRLVERALEKSGGNASAAARLLGESRYRMFSLQRYHEGKTPRPSRGQGGPSKRRSRRRD